MSAVAGIGQWGMGLGTLLASAAYLYYRRRDLAALDGGTLPEPTHRQYILATIGFFIALSAAALVNTQYYQYRPPLFFILVALAWSTLLVDILAIQQRGWRAAVTLAKICAISIYYRATRYYELATIPGNDTQFHLDLALVIYEMGELPPQGATSHPQYLFTSLWHHGIAVAQTFLSVEISHLPFLAAAIPFVFITVLGAYVLSRCVGGTVAHGLTAAFLISFADFFILRGASAIYTSSYVIPLTILTLAIFYRYHDWRGVGLATLMVAAILLTHQLSAFAALVVIGSTVVAVGVHRRYFGGTIRITHVASTPFLLVLLVALLGWWMIVPHGSGASFFGAMVVRGSGAVAGLFAASGGGYSESLAQYSALSNLFYNLGSDILFTIAVFGILLVSNRDNQSPLQLYLFAPTLCVFVLVYPATVLGLGDLLLPHRILAFFQFCLIIFAAIALIHVLRHTANPTHVALVGVAVFILVFAMVTTPYVNRNSPVYLEDREPRVDLYNSEAEAVLWTLAYNDTPIYHDSHLLGRQVNTLARMHGLEYDDEEFREYPENPDEPGLYIIREYFAQQEDVAPRGTFGDRGSAVDGDDITREYQHGDKTYDNGNVTIYTENNSSA